YDIGQGSAKIAVAVTDGQLIMGIAPTKIFDEFVGYMLGQKEIGRSLADVNVIQDIQAQYEFTPYAVGYVDIADITLTASGAAAQDPVTAAMLKALDYRAELSDICRQEIVSLVEKVPRVVVG